MRVEVLGSARAVAPDGSVLTFDRRHRRLLAALAAADGFATLESLTEAVWSGDPPVAAHKTTQNLLSDLRRMLGPACVERTADTYRLAGVEVDATQFSTLDSGTTDPVALRQALSWWRGLPFVELDDWPPAVIERARLVEMRLTVEERLAELELETAPAEVTADLEALVAADPYREHRWALLVRAHTAAGRRATALEVFQRARKVLIEHLGLEPGPELVAAERAALELPASARPALPQLRLVGREAEREAVLRAWERALEGSTQVLLVTGEAGVGKTHLARALAGELSAGGALVGIGRADEETGESFAPVGEAIRDLLLACGEREPDMAAQQTSRLTLLLAGPDASEPQATSEVAVAQLARQLDRALEELTTLGPVLLVMDDVHWAGRDALELLRLVLARERAARLLVLLCARNDPPTAIGAANDIVERTSGRTLALPGLSVEEVVELLGPQVRPLASSYHDETAGNPLACLLLEESGWEPGEMPPPTVATLVAARMARLDHDHHPFVEAAALTGSEFDAALVSVAVGASPSSVAAAEERGLIEPTATGLYRFRHPLFRTVIATSMPPETALARRRELAHTLVELAPSKAAEIARHLVDAAALDVTLRADAVRWARRAAEVSERRAAFDDAVSWYEAALRLHGTDDRERYDLLLGQSRALKARPDWVFRAPARAAAELAETALDDRVLAAEALLAANRDWPSATVDGPFVQDLETAVAGLGDREPALRARLLAALGAELVFDLDGWRRHRIADEALELAEATGDNATLAHVLCRRPAAVWDLATADDRWRSANRYLELASPGDVAGFLTAVSAAAAAAIERGDLDAATLLLARSARVSAELPSGHLTVLHDSVHLELLLARGELGEVRRLALLLPEGSGAPAVNFELCASLQDGDGGDAVTRLAAEIQPSELAPFIVLLGASATPEAAAATLATLPPAMWAGVPPGTVRPLLLGAAGYAAGVLRDLAHAEALLPLLTPFSDQLLCVGQVGVIEPIALTAGRLHVVLGDRARAAGCFRAAHGLAARMGNPHWQRQASEALAGLDAPRERDPQ